MENTPQSETEQAFKQSPTNSSNSSSKKAFSEKTIFFGTIALTILVFAGLIYVFAYKPATTPTGNVGLNTGTDEIVAIVGGQNLYLSDLQKRFETVPTDLQGQLNKTTILDNMIENTLVLQEAQRVGVTATQQEIDQTLEGQQEQVQTLIDEGKIDQDFLVQVVTDFVIVNKYLDQYVFSQVTVSEQEMLDFFNENRDALTQIRASHILVETKEEADAILAQIQAGENFEALAKEKSLDTASGELEGDLGFFSRSDVVTEFADAAFALNVGDAPVIAQSQFGFHIIKVTDKKDSFEDFSDQIEPYLKSQKQDQAYTDFIEKLKTEKGVQILYTESA